MTKRHDRKLSRAFRLVTGLVALTVLLGSSLALAQQDDEQQAPQQPRRARRRAQPDQQQQQSGSEGKSKDATPWGVALMGGLTFGAGSSYTTTTSTATVTGTDSPAGSFFFGGELTYDVMPWVALGIDVEWAGYNYNISTVTNDSEITALALGRLQYPVIDELLVWGGVGLGGTLTSIGTTTGGLSPIIPGSSSSTGGFTVSPRFGADYKVTDQFFAGAMFAYLNTRGSLSTTTTALPVAGQTVNLTTTETFTRSWLEFGVRIGMRF